MRDRLFFLTSGAFLGLLLAVDLRAEDLPKTDEVPQSPIQEIAKPTPDALSPDTSITSPSSFNWAQFQFGPTMGVQGGGSSFSLLVRYLPEYSFGAFALGPDLAFCTFGNAGGAEFTVTELGLHTAYLIDENWSVRLLLGAQSWAGNNGVGFFLGPELQYHFQLTHLPWLNGLFASYTAVMQANTAHLTTAGVTLKF